jgi:mRNA interferase RelE/StbE
MTAPSFAPFGRVSEFQIAESKTFCQSKQQLDFVLYDKIRSIVYPQLKKNPFCGPNIRQLTGELTGYHQFRIGGYRLFYLIEEKKAVVVMVALQLVRRVA